MSDAVSALADLFPPAPREAWLALVARTLKDRPLESLTWRTQDGVEIRPLYTAEDAADHGPLARAAADPERPWDVRTLVSHPDPARANAQALHDLENGAASLLLKLDPSGEDGVAVASSEDLERALQGVLLDLAPVALDAGFAGPLAADWLADLAKGGPQAPLAFHLDPLGAFAETGASPGPVDAHLRRAADTAAAHAATYPKASLFLGSGRIVHEAGGTEAQELGFAAAAALAYAKALADAGLRPADAFPRIVLGLSVDAEYFASIAKLRAARLIWARLTQACGAPVPARVEARASRRMLSRLDAWTNLLRLTAAGFAGAVGGADALVLEPFTQPLGPATDFARRQARNTQLVLMEEAHLGRVADPARGAWFVERFTEDLARAGWAFFQQIESAGGLAEALRSGLVSRAVADARAAREAELASGTLALVGVTRFPDSRPTDIAVDPVDPSAFARPAPDLRLPGPDDACPPLKPMRLAEPYEHASDRSGADGR